MTQIDDNQGTALGDVVGTNNRVDLKLGKKNIVGPLMHHNSPGKEFAADNQVYPYG